MRALRPSQAVTVLGVVVAGARGVARAPVAVAKLPFAVVHRALRVGGSVAGLGVSLVTRNRGSVDGELTEERQPPATVEPPRDDVVTRAAAAAQEAAEETATSPALTRDELPIPDFDHVTIGSLRGRLRQLDVEELRTLLGYEATHANRLPVLTMLENRIEKLSAEADAAG